MKKLITYIYFILFFISCNKKSFNFYYTNITIFNFFNATKNEVNRALKLNLTEDYTQIVTWKEGKKMIGFENLKNKFKFYLNTDKLLNNNKIVKINFIFQGREYKNANYDNTLGCDITWID